MKFEWGEKKKKIHLDLDTTRFLQSETFRHLATINFPKTDSLKESAAVKTNLVNEEDVNTGGTRESLFFS